MLSADFSVMGRGEGGGRGLSVTRKILIVEDDASTAAYLAKGLGEAGYSIETCQDGRDGLFLASEGIFDLIIADRMLPGLDGLAMVGAIRAAKVATPILVLSALAAVDDRVDGLKAGADDYLCKPFSFAELSARIEALVRRSDRSAAEPQKTKLSVGGSRDRPARAPCHPRGAHDHAGRARIQPARIPRPPCRAGRHPHDDAGENLELSFRSGLERGRRPHRSPAPQAGRGLGDADPAYRARRGLPARGRRHLIRRPA